MRLFPNLRKIRGLFAFKDLPRRSWQIVKLIINIPAHIQLRGTIQESQFIFAVKDMPQIQFKYLGRYLSSSLILHSRWVALVHHYSFIQRYCKSKLVSNLAVQDESLCTWGLSQQFSICLGVARTTYLEGELVIIYKVNNIPIYFMTFSILPGSLFDLSDTNILFIGGSQGARDQYELIKTATKENSDVSPQADLVVCIQALASCLGADAIVGIGANNQVAIDKNRACNYCTTYDQLWLSAGGYKIFSGDFSIPSNIHEKPLSEIKIGHRVRTRQKRNHKRILFQQIQHNFLQLLLIQDKIGQPMMEAVAPQQLRLTS